MPPIPWPLPSTRDWSDISEIIKSNKRFIFSTHLEPDADGFGSELALARFLKGIGKSVAILNPTVLRANLEFLPEPGEVEVYDSSLHTDLVMEAEVFISFDVGNYTRLGDLRKVLEKSACVKVSIDHHPGNKEQFDVLLDDAGASSTGVMVFDLLRYLDPDLQLDLSLAKPLYAAIMSDTGNFRFNNTDVETLQLATVLLGVGVKPYEIYVEIYENLNTPGRIEVLRHVLENLHYAAQGRLAWTTLDYDELSSRGVGPNDLHSLSDFVRGIRGVEIGVVLVKKADAPVDVSMRSKGRFPVNGVAGEFGGGGHKNASGCRIPGSLSDAEQALVAAFERVLEGAGND